MAKLPKAVAAAAETAESKDFSAIPPGTYIAKLDEVQTTKNGQELRGAQGPYWVWVFKVTSGKYSGRKLFLNTSFAESAAWKLKQVYEGMGFTLDSDTDEMVGEKCTLVVSQQVQTEGERKGQMRNNIDSVQEYDPALDEGDSDEAGSGAKAAAGAGVEF